MSTTSLSVSLGTGNVAVGGGDSVGYTNKLVPRSNGRVNGVNITALNARTRTSRASAVAAVSSWTTRASAADNQWTSLTWAPELSLFVAVAGSGTGNRVMTSPDGIIWTARTSAADNTWTSVTWAPELSLFVAVASSGTGNRVMTSPDGITWTARTSAADNNWGSVTWAPELSIFVATATTGTGNRVMTSPNGINWTARTSATDHTWISVTWAPEISLFVAVAYFGGTGNRVVTSPNGITWTTRTSAADNEWQSVTWSPELSIFAAVASTGSGNRVMTSPDGITWTTQTSAADYEWRSVTWAPELSIFVAIAGSGTGNRVMTSPDGITWTARTSGADNLWLSVTWAPELSIFVAVAYTGLGNRVMTSAIGMPNSKSVVKALPSQMTVLPNGNVGIGTTVPLAKLDIHGIVQNITNNVKCVRVMKQGGVLSGTTSDITVNVTDYGFGITGTIMVEITAGVYGSGGSGAGVFKAMFAGWAGYNITTHSSTNMCLNTYVNVMAANGSFAAINSTSSIFGVRIINTSGSGLTKDYVVTWTITA